MPLLPISLALCFYIFIFISASLSCTFVNTAIVFALCDHFIHTLGACDNSVTKSPVVTGASEGQEDCP